jgi:hypothetical protein
VVKRNELKVGIAARRSRRAGKCHGVVSHPQSIADKPKYFSDGKLHGLKLNVRLDREIPWMLDDEKWLVLFGRRGRRRQGEPSSPSRFGCPRLFADSFVQLN